MTENKHQGDLCLVSGPRPIERLGQYRLMEKLGEDGTGVVYRAQDERLGRAVALKVLGEGAPGDRGARGRLLREARAASALNHPNICTIHEIGEGSGQAYLVMEYVEGRTLEERVSRGGLPIGEVIRLGTQIAEALEHAHARGVVHRDLKPANVRVTSEGRAKVLDFGLAVRQPEELERATLSRDSLDEASAIAGTLPYMAPEVLRGDAAVERSDIWSLGVMLHEMAAGEKPFQGKTGFALSAAILSEPPRAFPKGVPIALGEVILRCLEKDPQRRYAKAAEVRAALQTLDIDENAWPALETSHLEEARPITTNRGGLRFGRWVPPWAAVLIGVGVVLAVGLVWYWRVLTARPGETEPRLVAEPKRLSTGGKPSKKAAANEYFEKARLALLSQSDLMRAKQMYARALELDPHFAEARADFGLIDELLFITGDSDDPSLLYKAEEELRRALADDPNCGRAHGVLASIYLNQGRKDLVPQEVHEALGVNPNDQDAQLWMLNYFALNGAYDAGEEWARKMLERNPVFWPARIGLAEMLREHGDSAGSIREDQKVLEQDPKNTHALLGLARTYMSAGKLPEARKMLEEVPPPGRANYQTRSMRALLLALEGKRAEARKEMDDKVLKYLGAVPCCTVTGAEFFAVLGQTDLALDWLGRAVRNGDERAEWFRRDPLLEKLRKHPKFEQIFKSIEFRRQQVAKP